VMAVLKHILASLNSLSLIMSNVFCTGGDLRYLFKEYLVDTRGNKV
jgi:hypothetical protein